jgi:hypothetical protein
MGDEGTSIPSTSSTSSTSSISISSFSEMPKSAAMLPAAQLKRLLLEESARIKLDDGVQTVGVLHG